MYEETAEYAAKLSSADHIVLIRSLRNPMPVLKNAAFLSCPLIMKGRDW